MAGEWELGVQRDQDQPLQALGPCVRLRRLMSDTLTASHKVSCCGLIGKFRVSHGSSYSSFEVHIFFRRLTENLRHQLCSYLGSDREQASDRYTAIVSPYALPPFSDSHSSSAMYPFIGNLRLARLGGPDAAG